MQKGMAIATVKYFTISGSGALASAASLGQQLTTPHVYLNLHLPYWFFLVSMVLLNFIGAFLSLKTDYMQASGTTLGNFATAFLVGLVLSFVIIPTINPTSGVGLMQIASFVSGLCGTIFLRVIINILNRQDLQEAIVELIVSNSIRLAEIAIRLAVDHTAKLITALLVGIIASLAYTNNVSNQNNDNPAPQSQVTEVAND